MSFDLSFERFVDASARHLYDGWTRPELLVQWFTPAPWRTTDAEVTTVPGGIFRTVMCGPDGERNEGTGCVLEAIPGERFSWTNLMGPGFAPNALGEGDFGFTATIAFEPVEGGTRYTATVRHVDKASMRDHEQMGFHDGWNAALDQLLELIRRSPW